MDVSEVVVARDSRLVRSGALDPVRTEQSLDGAGLGPQAARRRAPERSTARRAGSAGRRLPLSDLTRRAVPEAERPGGVRVHPDGAATVLEGDAEGVPALAGHGLLDPDPCRCSWPATPRARDCRGCSRAGSTIVLTDSARRRTFVAASAALQPRPHAGPRRPDLTRLARFDAFPGRGRRRADGGSLPRRAARLLARPARLLAVPPVPALRRAGRPPRHVVAGRRERRARASGTSQVEPERPRRVRSISISPARVNRYGAHGARRGLGQRRARALRRPQARAQRGRSSAARSLRTAARADRPHHRRRGPARCGRHRRARDPGPATPTSGCACPPR